MDTETTNQLQQQFKSLPLELQEAITNTDISSKLQEIVKNNKLMLDQAANLETETLLVLYGLEPLESYLKNLIENVGLSSIQASVITHDVNESIFKGVREALKNIGAQIEREEKMLSEKSENPTKEEIIAGIETPENIQKNEPSVSMSAVSNIPTPELHPEMAKEGIEIAVSHLPEIAPKIPLPTTTSFPIKKSEPLHINIPPVQNIIQTKLTETVVVPKEQIIIEEKTKLPEKPKSTTDPYREAAI